MTWHDIILHLDLTETGLNCTYLVFPCGKNILLGLEDSFRSLLSSSDRTAVKAPAARSLSGVSAIQEMNINMYKHKIIKLSELSFLIKHPVDAKHFLSVQLYNNTIARFYQNKIQNKNSTKIKVSRVVTVHNLFI